MTVNSEDLQGIDLLLKTLGKPEVSEEVQVQILAMLNSARSEALERLRLEGDQALARLQEETKAKLARTQVIGAILVAASSALSGIIGGYLARPSPAVPAATAASTPTAAAASTPTAAAAAARFAAIQIGVTLEQVTTRKLGVDAIRHPLLAQSKEVRLVFVRYKKASNWKPGTELIIEAVSESGEVFSSVRLLEYSNASVTLLLAKNHELRLKATGVAHKDILTVTLEVCSQEILIVQ